MSQLLDFYRQLTPDSEGRMLEDIWQWDHAQLEACHDYIQWLFPLDVASNFNPDAPLLTKEDMAAFRRNDLLQDHLRKSFEMWIDFVGLDFAVDDSPQPARRIIKGPNFEARKSLWARPNHNWLRMTRVLKSLKLCGLEKQAAILFDCLQQIHAEGYVSEESFAFWKDAAGASGR
jgi:hypothetical protein